MHSTVMRSEMSLVSQNGVSLRLCAQSALLPLLPNSIHSVHRFTYAQAANRQHEKEDEES